MVEFEDCIGCDTVCCKNTAMHLFPDEYERISKFYPDIDKHIKRVTDTYYCLQFPDGSCPFLEDYRHLCTLRLEGIEPPLACQFGPFYISQEMDTNNRVILTVGRNSVCPAAKKVEYDSEFSGIFFKIVRHLKQANPNTTFFIDENWLLEGEFW